MVVVVVGSFVVVESTEIPVLCLARFRRLAKVTSLAMDLVNSGRGGAKVVA